MGPKARLFLDTLVVGMNQAEEGLLYASVGNPPSIAFPVPAEHKPDGMGVASVSEAGIEILCVVAPSRSRTATSSKGTHQNLLRVCCWAQF